MKILVACEESQEVCKAFRELGHEAFSCDILPCSGGHPEWHIMGDVLQYINGNCQFFTLGGGYYLINGSWDLVIAHPPCTDLAVSGARWFREKQMDFRQQKACVFFMRMMLCNADHIAVENPVGIMSKCYRKPDQNIQPYEYGHPYRKTTCLWLKNLPLLKPTEIVEPELITYTTKSGKKVSFSADYGVGFNRDKESSRRAKTYPGIAKAMAEQWSKYIEETPSGIKPISDDDAVYGYLCGWCNHSIAYGQNYCDECGKEVLWDE